MCVTYRPSIDLTSKQQTPRTARAPARLHTTDRDTTQNEADGRRRTPLTGPAEPSPAGSSATTRHKTGVQATSPLGPRTGQSASPLWSLAISKPRAAAATPYSRKRPARETRGLPCYHPTTAPPCRSPRQTAGAGAERTNEAPSPPRPPARCSLQPLSISSAGADSCAHRHAPPQPRRVGALTAAAATNPR